MWKPPVYDLRRIVPTSVISGSWPLAFTDVQILTPTGDTVYSPWITIDPDTAPYCTGIFSIPATEIQSSNGGTCDIYIELQTTGNATIITYHVKKLTPSGNWSAATWNPSADTIHIIIESDCANLGPILRARWQFISNKPATFYCVGPTLARWL
jgi:hypothetical protein